MSSLRFAAGGTLVMPTVAPNSSFHDISSHLGWAPPPDCLEPDRWSTPPAAGLSPIIPCDEPEEDDSAKILTAVRTPVPPSWLPRQNLPSYADEIAHEPVILPVSEWPKIALASALWLLMSSGLAAAAFFLI